VEEGWIGLEKILVEVLIAGAAGTEDELSRDVRSIVDAASQITVFHVAPLWLGS
jgi:hypothetical protein